MSKIFYTSDLHLGNSNIIEHEKRPWKTVEEMDTGLIENWNKVVGQDDHVYVLGDFCFRGAGKALEYLGMLNGYIHLIRGNHDGFLGQQSFINWVNGSAAIPCPPDAHITAEGWYKHMMDGDKEVVLCHFPILYWDGMDERGSIHLYGHMHSRPNMQHPHPMAYNVGVDVNNYRPVTLEQLMKKNANY